MISIPEKIQNSIILILIVAVGLFLRAYKFGYYPLGFDNLQIITSAEKIVEGDLVFLGPRTGPAEMFTGPLIYYVAAPFLFLGFSHYTAIFVPLFLALLTGITLAWLTKVVEREQHLILALWAFSPLLIPMDRILWNPNLTVLASSLTFFPLLALERKYRYQLFGKHIPTEFLLFVGAFLGYQAHFSGLILAPLACIYLVVRRYKNVWLYGALFVGFLASLLPTVLFDIKNNYLNTRGLLSLLEGKTGFGLVGFFTTLLHAMQISLENLGGVLLEGNSLELILIAGVVVVLTTLLLYKKITEKEKKLFQLSFFWILGIAVCFSLYSGQTPEYYYFVQLPAIFYILASVLGTLLSALQKKIIFILFTAVYVFFLLFSNMHPLNLEIKNQDAIVQSIDELVTQGEVSEIIFDMQYYDALGLEYLLEKKAYNLNPKGKPLHILYPYHAGNLATTVFSNSALWLDPRIDAEKNYLSKPDFIIETPLYRKLLETTYERVTFGDELYAFVDDGIMTEQLLHVQHVTDQNIHLYRDLILAVRDDGQWHYISVGDQTGNFFRKGMIIFYLPASDAASTTYIEETTIY